MQALTTKLIKILMNFQYKNSAINFADIGEGKTVVLLHGYLENCSMWDFCIKAFSHKYRLVAIDLLGHGKSDSIGYIHTMEEQAEMVYAVLQHLNIRKAKFIGHSMGGYVALAFAEKFPKIVTGLVLLNSTSLADSPEKVDNRNRAIKVVKQNYQNFVRLSIANLFASKSQTIFAKSIEHTKQEALKTTLQGIIAAQEGMKIRKNRLFLLSENNNPILLILGENDSVLDYHETKLQIVNTNVNLVTLSGGHMSHIENREELLVVLKNFI